MKVISIQLFVQASLLAAICFSISARADLAGSVLDFQKGEIQVIRDAGILNKDAGSCGFVGSQISAAMTDVVTDVVTDVKKSLADFKLAIAKGKAGIPTLQSQADANTKSNTQMESNLNMARYGLSTDSATCKTALAAFENMRTLSLQNPNKLEAIIALIQTVKNAQ